MAALVRSFSRDFEAPRHFTSFRPPSVTSRRPPLLAGASFFCHLRDGAKLRGKRPRVAFNLLRPPMNEFVVVGYDRRLPR